jgi:hypothetical protein
MPSSPVRASLFNSGLVATCRTIRNDRNFVANERFSSLSRFEVIPIGLICVQLISLVRFVTPNYTTCRRSYKSMMTGEMAGSTAYGGTLEAAFCFHRLNGCESK